MTPKNEGPGGGGKKDENRERRETSVEDWPLLMKVFSKEKKVKDTGVEEEVTVEDEELERRYCPNPDRILEEEELLKLSKDNFREITQAYISLNAFKNTDSPIGFRLRKTWSAQPPEDGGTMFRVTRKVSSKVHPGGQREIQYRFREKDPSGTEHPHEEQYSEDEKQFHALWEQHVFPPLFKRRYYIPWKLPNGNMCEIHYDVHHGDGDPRLAGYVRIEAEFQSTEDANESRKHGAMPEWVGRDVTGEEAYKSKSLAAFGPPKE